MVAIFSAEIMHNLLHHKLKFCNQGISLKIKKLRRWDFEIDNDKMWTEYMGSVSHNEYLTWERWDWQDFGIILGRSRFLYLEYNWNG